MPQQTRNQNRSSTGCWGEVIVALAAVERPWSWGWIFSCKRGERGGGGVQLEALEQIVFVVQAATSTTTAAYATWKIHYHEVNFY